MAFPNLKGKHAHDAMFTPSDFFAYQLRVGKDPRIKADAAILCYSKRLLAYAREQQHKLTTPIHKSQSHQIYLIRAKGKRIIVYGGFGIGAPAVGTILEELIAMGVKRFLSVGTAGGLQKDLDVGDIVICDKAIRDEGTSHHYLPPSKYAYASKTMVAALAKALTKKGMAPRIGASWTIDAPYRETVREARQYQNEGVLTVEMEASALFAIAKARKVEIGCIFTISDSLAAMKWNPQFDHKKTALGVESLYDVAVEALTHK